MPPSGHSSSSHSSHSFGGSSHSFGGGSSGGFSSGPSRHSGSSHSSMPFSSSFSRPSPGMNRMPGMGGMGGMNRPGPRPAYFSRPAMQMRFPAPPRDTYRYSDRIFFGLRHQYRYYPTAFIINGINYGAGYYDEDGTYYKNLEMEDENGNTVKYLTCEYCGCQAEYKPEDGAIPNCAHCGAPLKVENIHKDSAYKAGSSSGSETGDKPAKISKFAWFIIIICVAFFIFNVISDLFFSHDDFDDGFGGYGNSQSYSQSANQYTGGTLYLKGSGDTYTVSDSGSCSKKLTWDSSTDSYYDKDTECWVWCNTDVTPALWQYWYEGISSKYGDYGWMEYENGKWYIETGRDNWKQYTGDTSKLWHIE